MKTKTIIGKQKKRQKDFAYWYNMGNLLSSHRRFKKAIKCYDRAFRNTSSSCDKSDYVECWYKRGLASHGLGNPEDAILSYDKALAINPTESRIYVSRGIDLNLLNRYQEALESYDKAVEIQPDLHEAWSRRGDVLFRLGRSEDALKAYDKALEINPNEVFDWIGKSKVLDLLGREHESRDCKDKAVEIRPTLNTPLNWRGIAFYAGRIFVAEHPLSAT